MAFFFFFFQAEDGIRDLIVTGVQTCALPIFRPSTLPWPFSTCTITGIIVLAQTGGGVGNEERALFCPHPYARRRKGPRQRRALPARRRADRRGTLFLVGRLLHGRSRDMER